MKIINQGNCGERAYKIALGTGTAWVEEFIAYAYNEQDALDFVADHLEAEELNGLYFDYATLKALAKGFTKAGFNDLDTAGNGHI